MRWSYLIPRVVVLAGIVVYTLFGLDPTLLWGGRFAVSSAVGRVVELSDVRTQFWPPSMEATNLQVADASAEAAEFHLGRIAVRMNPESIKHRRAIADEVLFEDVRWDVPADFEVETPAEEEDAEPSAWAEYLKGKSQAAFEEQVALIEGRLKETLDPDRLETVRLAKSKEDAYREDLEALRHEYLTLRDKADAIRMLAESAERRRALLLQPERLQASIRDARLTRERLQGVRTRLLSLRTRLPQDLNELSAAKDRDLTMLRTEFEDLTAAPVDAASVILGEPVGDAMRFVAFWWPQWKRFRDSSEWNELHAVEGRGRTIAFLPEHDAAFAGANRVLFTGMAERSGAEWPFEAEFKNLVYPPRPDDPAAFRWTSGGETPVRAIGRVDVQDGRPQLSLRFRVERLPGCDSDLHTGSVKLAFHCDRTAVEGTVTAAETFGGTLRVHLPNSAARFTSDRPELAALVQAFDVESPELTPVVQFQYDGRPDVQMRCEQLAGLGDQWKQGLVAAARQQGDRLRSQAAQLLDARLHSLAGFNEQLTELAVLLPGIQMAELPFGGPDGQRLSKTPLGRGLLERVGFQRTAEGPPPSDNLLKSVFR